MDFNLFTILIAYLLDLIFGDPEWQWHPVRIIGGMITDLEKRLNVSSDNKILRGFILSLIVIGAVGLAVWFILKLAWTISPAFYFLISTLFIYFGLSIKDLAVQAYKVKAALLNEDIAQARKQLAMIVGRDTEALDGPEIIRASVETVAESAMDGIIGPLFYCFFGGPVLMWVYKAINTLDSMIGHRNQRFMEFGKFAAKLDAMMNFIPARITAFLIGLSSGLCGKDLPGAFKWGFRYFLRGPETNSRLPEAAMAGALGVRLGGINYYQGAARSISLFGDNRFPLGIKHISDSIRIAYTCSGLAMIFGVACVIN